MSILTTQTTLKEDPTNITCSRRHYVDSTPLGVAAQLRDEGTWETAAEDGGIPMHEFKRDRAEGDRMKVPAS